MLNTEITFALAEWIRVWIKESKQTPSLNDCFKFVEWKTNNSELSDSDKLQIEAIFLYEISN